MIRIDIANRQNLLSLDRRLLRRAVRAVLGEAGVADAEISLAVVDDAAMRRLHHRYLGDDSATDVLSFVLDCRGGRLEGEVIVSAETARSSAPRYRHSPAEELLLYVVHGTLHLIGCRDDTPAARAAMSRRQRRIVKDAMRPERGPAERPPAHAPRRMR